MEAGLLLLNNEGHFSVRVPITIKNCYTDHPSDLDGSDVEVQYPGAPITKSFCYPSTATITARGLKNPEKGRTPQISLRSHVTVLIIMV